MSTDILVVNHGPHNVAVDVMGAGVVEPPIVCRTEQIFPRSESRFLVYQSQYLVVRELTPVMEPTKAN